MIRFAVSGTLATTPANNIQIWMTANPKLNCPKKVTLSDKMSHYFSNEESSVSMVPPSNSSYLTRNIFTHDHRKYLLKVCSSMVKSGIISQTVVKDLLSKGEEGKDLREFTIKQSINRLKYERRLNHCK